eukprot:5576009-Amphidinium_carterae.2
MRSQYLHGRVISSSVSLASLVHPGGGMDGIPDRWDSAVSRLVASLESSGFGAQQACSDSQSSLAVVKYDKRSDDENGSRVSPGDDLAVKVSAPDPSGPSEDECPPTQLDLQVTQRDLTPTKPQVSSATEAYPAF